ncbi:hypothetical protein K466DRAFT_486784 [Polyporus arcularius HHB13444]|uniref:Uncharacterized protein n=1 Tax=Polyporus arcularius HHB13444 TaxID=1314778 RepID=A0A5C3PI43_9APHY|nr:hypothetical protein K466DRAFT_486784 [Polyporus arcularius HHB13444]
MSSVAVPQSHWLSDCLCELMSSPHVAMPPHGGMHMGPGPVDMFTVRFNEFFMPEAHGTICGHPVDREELKDRLLNLQKRWNSEDIKVVQEGGKHGFPLQPSVLSTEVEFTPPGHRMPEVVMAEASVGEQEGHERIRFLKMEGNSALFRV